MLKKIIEWSINNKFLVILATVFLIGWGIYSLVNIPIDAIPDLSDAQVIIYTEFSGQSPRIVEDQVTYPLTTAMVSVPSAKVVRGYSFFGYSLVYVIFEDGTDIYWARSTGSGISQLCRKATAGQCDADAGAGRNRRGLGV